MLKSFITRSAKVELKYFVIVKNPLLDDGKQTIKVNQKYLKVKKIKYSLL